MCISTKEYENGIYNYNVVALGLVFLLPISNKMSWQVD